MKREKEAFWSKRKEEQYMRFEINYIIKPGAILFSNLEDMKSMLNSYAEEKIAPC